MDSKIFGVLMGVWFVVVGAYSYYFAFMMKQTGTIKTGWIVSKEVQLKESRDLPGFIEAVCKKTNIFATIAMAGGFLFIIGAAANMFTLMLVCMLVLIVAYIWYSSLVRSAEKKYLSPDLKKKVHKKR